MRLNLYQILERLPCSWQVRGSRNPGAFEISQVRLYSPGMQQTRPDVLYVARCQDVQTAYRIFNKGTSDNTSFRYNDSARDTLKKETTEKAALHMLICGGVDEDIASGSFLSVTTLDTDEADLLWIFDRVQDILMLYQEWDADILAGIWEHVPMQETFDRCAELLGRPAGVFDLQQNLLMKTGSPESIVKSDRLWKYTLENGFAPYETEQAAEFNRMFHGARKPFLYASREKFPEAHRIVAPLFLKDAVFACLGMHDSRRELSDGEIADFAMVQGYLNHAFSHTDEFHYTGQHMPWFIIQLLQGRAQDPALLSYNFKRMDIHMEQPFILWNFRRAAGSSLEKLLPIISYLLHCDQVFDYNGNILAIDTCVQEHRSTEFVRTLGNLLVQHHLICGQSMIFHSALLLREAYLQTETAILVGRQEKVNAYLDCYQTYLRRCIGSQPEKEGLLYPGIRALCDSDPEYGPELLRCLQSYILMGCNASKTAKSLYIHRHTVLYRIEKIETYLGVRIDELEEKERALLYMSCLMLAEEA